MRQLTTFRTASLVERKAYLPSPDSPFVIFREDSGAWSIGHRRSELRVNTLIPARLPRSKGRLTEFLKDMAEAEPEAVAMVGLAEGFPMPYDLRSWGQRLVDWAAQYPCI